MAQKENEKKKEGDIHDGHRERMKKQYRQVGLEHLADHQVLELLLFYAIPRRDTNELAHQLIDKLGGFPQVFRADFDQLAAQRGMSPNAATLLRLVPDVARRIVISELDEQGSTVLNSDEKAAEYLRICFTGRTRETVMLLCLDSGSRLLRRDIISEGDMAVTEVDVRRLCKIVLQCSCHHVILAHNHPAGRAYPSNQDIRFTEHLRRLLKDLNVKLLDHFILGRDGSCASMMQMGYLAIDQVNSPE